MKTENLDVRESNDKAWARSRVIPNFLSFPFLSAFISIIGGCVFLIDSQDFAILPQVRHRSMVEFGEQIP